MERRVVQPGASQTRPSLLTGEGAGILPGRLPFIDPAVVSASSDLLFARGDRPVSARPKNFVEKTWEPGVQGVPQVRRLRSGGTPFG